MKISDNSWQIACLETEVLAHEIIAKNTKLKLQEVLEYNNTRDLFSNDYILFLAPEEKLLDSIEITQENKIQIDDFQSNFYKINNGTFGNLNENHSFSTWSEYFHFHWQQMMQKLHFYELLDESNLNIIEEFYQSLKDTLAEESTPVLINLNLENNLFIGSFGQINGYADYTNCIWGTPEYELAKRDYLKFLETPLLLEYKQQIKVNINAKAKYFLYLVSFLWEETLLQYFISGQTFQSQKFKSMAITLIKNALS